MLYVNWVFYANLNHRPKPQAGVAYKDINIVPQTT